VTQRKNNAWIGELGAVLLLLLLFKFSWRIPAVQAAFTVDQSLMARWQLWAAWVGWVIFSIYWEIAKSRNTQATKVESAVSRGIHALLVNVALLMVVAPVRGLGRFEPESSVLLSPLMTLGIAVEATGLFVAIWARRHLGRYWSGEITLMADHQLIRTGPYRKLRHPIYTGLLSMYAGSALITGTWVAIIGVAVAVLAYLRKLRLEEANMLSAFGLDYEEYRRESWALLPGIV
jgi:protein-S-isoprenylcysteine O-methyltransferase Ste14